MAVTDLALLLIVAALWGASFLFIREAAPVLGPIGLIEARVLLAGLALLAGAAVRRVTAARRGGGRRDIGLRRDIGGFLMLGALSAAVPFTLIAAAELHLTASLAAILNATTPLFALLLAAARRRRPPSRRQLGGVFTGIAGVAVLVGLGPLRVDGALILATAASLLAALFYALGGVYAESRFPGADPVVTATGQQLGAAAILLVPALAVPPRHAPGGGVLLAVLTLALACTSLGFALFYRLLNNVGPTGALTVTFLVPLFGLLWGTVFLDEHLTWSTPLGLALVLGAVFLVTAPPGARLPHPRTPAGCGRRL